MRLRVFADLWWHGNDYYAQPRFQIRLSWFVAGVIARTCREIRQSAERST